MSEDVHLSDVEEIENAFEIITHSVGGIVAISRDGWLCRSSKVYGNDCIVLS